MLAVADIEPNPFQPRVNFDAQALEELTASIRALGLIQPITVRPMGGGHYQIISGERRWRASKAAGLSQIPVYVKDADNTAMLEMAIVENVQRSDLDPIETAMSYRRLIDECSLTQEEMADRIGKGRVVVTNMLRLLKLPARVQYDVKVGNISVGHAKVLLSIDDPALQESLCDVIIREGLSVRALEQKLKQAKPETPTVKADDVQEEIPELHYSVADMLGRYFNNNVSLKRRSDGSGSFTVRFANDAQLQAFLERLKQAES